VNDEPRRKLIEVALPLETINRESSREKSIRHGHPSTLHLWWAPRPLAACRAVLFASLIDDPSSRPDLYSEEQASHERERLFGLIEKLVRWESTTDEGVLEEVREEILRHTDGNPPPILDPFCGGGSIPLEAQRLGLESHASDLNPVAVLITKALAELPPKFRGLPPVNPAAADRLNVPWREAQGLADDVRFYGRWIRHEAERRIGETYPKVREDDGSEATVVAWIWGRTIQCRNPACRAEIPLLRSFMLSSKSGRQVWLQPAQDGDGTGFEIRTGDESIPGGTVNRRGARCLVCDTHVGLDHVRSESRAGRMGRRLLAIVADGNGGRRFHSANRSHEDRARRAQADWRPDGAIADNPGHTNVFRYGLTTWGDLFTDRQLLALGTFSDLVESVRAEVEEAAGRAELDAGARDAYADAVTTYLALAMDRLADYGSTLATWATGGFVRGTFARQALPMVWDFAETNPFSGSTGSWDNMLEGVCRAIERVPARSSATVRQLDATSAVNGVEKPMICTDPPYYDNIGYADLSDFFYVWLRRSIRGLYPDLFSTLLTPKGPELIAAPHRFEGNKKAAQEHFETGLHEAFAQIHKAHSADYPMTLFYAFKQEESDKDGRASTGWETMLEGLLGAGFMVTGTWPMRTERGARSVAIGTAALASSIVLVCRPRPASARMATRKEFTAGLRAELPDALRCLQSGSIAPVDLAQAAIGPGMAVFSRYSKVVEADGEPMRVRSALALINEALDELLAEQEADFDADTRWCVAWFEQHGMGEGPFGVAETLSRAKNTAIGGLVEAGTIASRSGKVRLLERAELATAWDPAADARLTVWEVTQHLIARHQNDGEAAAATLLSQIGGALSEAGRELAYRLFSICERNGWAQEAIAYNALVLAWPELTRLAAQDTGEEPADGKQETMEF
jgi:putative DNA methylase